MGKLFKENTEVNQATTASNFTFSAKAINELGSDEYTIVSIAVDTSSSVSSFKQSLNESYKNIIKSCRKHPRSESLLVRGVSFASNVQEEHGFVELENIDESQTSFDPHGMTCLYDATLNQLEALRDYGKRLFDMQYLTNAVLFVVTDGYDTCSRIANPDKITALRQEIEKLEVFESIKMVLVGVGLETQVQTYLDDYKNQAGFDQFVFTKDASESDLAKLADFVSRSISSTSESLGTGGPSQDLSL